MLKYPDSSQSQGQSVKQDSAYVSLNPLPSFFIIMIIIINIIIINIITQTHLQSLQIQHKGSCVFFNCRRRGESCSDVHHYLNISSSSEQMNVAEHQGVCSPALFIFYFF